MHTFKIQSTQLLWWFVARIVSCDFLFYRKIQKKWCIYLMKTDKDNLWRENEGREARSKHSEIMAKRIEASDGETTTEWRNRRHPDGDFVSTKKIKNQQRFLLRPWSSAEINAHGSDLIWSNLIWSIVIRRWRIDLWHTSHSSNVSLSLSARAREKTVLFFFLLRLAAVSIHNLL